MSARWVLLVAALTVASGCMRTGVDAAVRNETDTSHEVHFEVLPQGRGERLGERFQMAPHSSRELGKVIGEEGDYLVRASADGGAPVERWVNWSRAGGPDRITVWVRDDGIEIAIAVV